MSSQLTLDLVKKAQSGDCEAFGKLYGIYADDMYRFAVYYTSSSYYAHEAVSEAVLSAFENIGKLKNAESFKSWIFKILFFKCTKKQKEKAQSAFVQELSAAENISAAPHDYIRNFELNQAMEKLSEKEREIVILSFACGYTSDEIGQMLNLKAATVRSKLSRAAAKIRNYMTSEN